MAFKLRFGKRDKHESLQEQVGKLVAQKKCLEAIELLSKHISTNPSPEIEIQLTQLRHDAFFVIDHGKPEGSWPPIVTDLFTTSTGIPEIDSKEINGTKARSGVFNHGSLIVRNLLAQDQIETLASSIENAFNAFDNVDQLDQTHSWFSPLKTHNNMGDLDADRPWVREGGGVLAAESPHALFNLVDIFEKTGVIALITEFLGERPALSVRKTTLRKTSPKTRAEFGWHQDGAFLGHGIRTLNVWVALTDCGIDSPSMDMIPRRLEKVLPTGTEGALFNWSVSPAIVEKVCEIGQPQHLLFKAGDAIIFDEVNLHRTSSLPGMNKDRLAIESWFFAPSCYPLDQLPILI
jgi:hypothetical protein